MCVLSEERSLNIFLSYYKLVKMTWGSMLDENSHDQSPINLNLIIIFYSVGTNFF